MAIIIDKTIALIQDLAGNALSLVSGNPKSTTISVPTAQKPQRTFRASFAKSITGGVNPDLFDIIGSIGTGQTVNQTNGNLVITAGTTPRSEVIIRSKESFNGSLRMSHKITLSQRNANNSFVVELVDVIGDGLSYTINSATSITVNIPSHTFTSENVGQFIHMGAFAGSGTFIAGRYAIASISGDDVNFTVAGFAVGSGTCSLYGWNAYKETYTGATATSMQFSTQKDGRSAGDITSAINTTASGHISVLRAENLEVIHTDKVTTSGTAVQYTQRGNTNDDIIDEDVELFIQIRSVNGTVAPTATTCTIGFVSVEDYVPQEMSIVSVKPQGVSDGLPTRVLGGSITATVSGSVTANGGTSFANPVVNLTGDTGAKTATGNGATQTNTYVKGAQIVVNVGTVTGTSPTAVFKVQGSADSGTTWFDIPGATTATITTTGVYGITIYPGITPVAGVATSGTTACCSSILPRTFRMVWTIGGTTPSFTITNIQVSSIL